MKNFILIVFVASFSLNVFSQTVLLEEDVTKLDFLKPKFGQNMTNYYHWFVDYGFFASPSEGIGADIYYGLSHTFSVGNRYKRRLNDFLAVGVEASYLYMVYNLEQNAEKTVPNNIQHKKEKFRLNTVNGGVYFRLNFGKRGNIVGKFIDIGTYGNWAFNLKHTYTDKIDDSGNPVGYKEQKTVNKQLNYFEPFSYGFIVRMGINRYTIFGMYRMSDYFNEEFKENIPDVELSRLAVGLQIGLHK